MICPGNMCNIWNYEKFVVKNLRKIGNSVCSFEVHVHILVKNDPFYHELITSFVKVTSYLVSQEHATQVATLYMVTVSEEDYAGDRRKIISISGVLACNCLFRVETIQEKNHALCFMWW